MYDYKTIKLMHRHGNADWAPYSEGSDHTPASHDMERSWLKRGARIFKCTECADEIMVLPETAPPDEQPGQGA